MRGSLRFALFLALYSVGHTHVAPSNLHATDVTLTSPHEPTTPFVDARNRSHRAIEIVLAHCAEDTTWIDDMGYGHFTTSYDTCGNSTGPGRHVALPHGGNTVDTYGRHGGTYLSHIVNNYDSLADWNTFT